MCHGRSNCRPVLTREVGEAAALLDLALVAWAHTATCYERARVRTCRQPRCGSVTVNLMKNMSVLRSYSTVQYAL